MRASISSAPALGRADVQRPEAALVVRRDRHRLEDALDLRLAEALARAAARCAAAPTSCCAHGQAVIPWAATPTSAPRAALGRERHPVERVDLLRVDARHRRRLVLGVARRDRDLGAQRALALAHELGHPLREVLGAEGRLAEHDLADRLVDDLLEARHVRALLVGSEVDEALEPRPEQLLGAVLADPDHLLDAGHADAREADRERRRLRLDVGRLERERSIVHARSRASLPSGERSPRRPLRGAACAITPAVGAGRPRPGEEP